MECVILECIIKKSCSLAIKINEDVYPVSGTDIDDHGDSHAKDGFCNAIRAPKLKEN